MKKPEEVRAARLGVLKTYKLYVGGKFPRSESGRVYGVTDARGGTWLANASRYPGIQGPGRELAEQNSSGAKG